MITKITKTILLINSDAHIREVLHACLTHLGGWQVSSTASPSEGLDHANQNPPTAIVLDLHAFGMTSLTFLQRLRAQDMTQNVPVVLVALGAKWLNIEPLREFEVAGLIDYSIDPAALPQQIAMLLHWDQEVQAGVKND